MQLLKASQALPNDRFVVATNRGIFYKMQQLSPQKTFIEAPTTGRGASCSSCSHCLWMAMNNLQSLKQSLITGNNEIVLDSEIMAKAKVPPHGCWILIITALKQHHDLFCPIKNCNASLIY